MIAHVTYYGQPQPQWTLQLLLEWAMATLKFTDHLDFNSDFETNYIDTGTHTCTDTLNAFG